MNNLVKCERDNGIFSITMDRPEKKNAINLEMYGELKNAVNRAEMDEEVRVILIAGDGGVFTSGNDLADFLNFPEDLKNNPAIEFINAIALAKKPLIASVSGLAIGIGVTMLLHCDIVIAGKSTVLQMPFVNLGLCPEAGSTFLLPLIAGYQKAAKVILSGETFTAEEAYHMGIVSYLVEDGELKNFTHEVADKIASKPKDALVITKKLLKRGFASPLSTLMEEESIAFLSLLKKEEVRNNIVKFLNKKK